MAKKKMPIKKAIQCGRLIPFDDLFASYSIERQERIRDRVRYLKFAMLLRDMRRQRKLSQAMLAKKMSVKREYISRIESGRQNITLETLFRIGDVFKKNVEVQFTHRS